MKDSRLPVALAAVTLATVALAGCSGSDQPAAAPSEDTVSAPATTDAASADASAAPGSDTASGQASDQTAVDTIPARLQGRWGLVPADCTSTRGDAKGLVVVAPDQLTFYESVARLVMVREATDRSLTGRFDFSGEGQQWTLEVALASPDGRTMTRKDTGPDAMPGTLTYTRCA